ncbi:transposase IS4 family protein [Pseudanabaena biceps PCC 7429]|uniref:Transposase IS4 family protein n=1 Tax=Pseudanabaena biceps PCC 7429 TaxID=927668 RepID=L8MRS9_9CYAN|nr:transposase IS4 family protein [Pseudanabaena biceps PCC 7429]
MKNQIQFRYVLNDSWFASSENMRFIKGEQNKDFIMPLKDNRKM